MKSSLKSRYAATLFLMFGFTGCVSNRYEIQMVPNGKTMHRELTCYRKQSGNDQTNVVELPLKELVAIASAYNVKLPHEPSAKHSFAADFVGKMPNDVGGSGTYMHWQTPFGSASTYVERFRGNDDMAGDIERRLAAIERATDTITSWITAELNGEPGADRLRTFVDQSLRRDLKNITLYSWAFQAVSAQGDVDRGPDWIVRVGQYLVERGYFKLHDLPELSRAAMAYSTGDPDRLFAIIQRFVATRMGVQAEQPVPESLAFLASEESIKASFIAYLSETDEYQLRLQQWKTKWATEPANEARPEKPEPTDSFAEWVTQAWLPNFELGRGDRLQVSLSVPTEPLFTNGHWDKEKQEVRWSGGMLEADSELSEFPVLFHAFWCEPNEPSQRECFGRVVLEGEKLAQYCLWFEGLTRQESKQWNDFVATWKPNSNVATRLQDFRFAHEIGKPVDKDLAVIPRTLLSTLVANEDSP